jgi:cobalamin synthase
MSSWRLIGVAGLAAAAVGLLVWQLSLAPAADRTTAVFLAGLGALAAFGLTLLFTRRAGSRPSPSGSRSDEDQDSHSPATILLLGVGLFAMPFIAALPSLARVSVLGLLAGILLGSLAKFTMRRSRA